MSAIERGQPLVSSAHHQIIEGHMHLISTTSHLVHELKKKLIIM